MTRYFLQLATILIFILSCLSLNAATIKGRIVNSNNGEGISNATIKVINQKYFAISDAQGNYVLQNLPAGKYFAIAKSIGYEESAQELIVKNSNEIITYNFSLNSNNTSIQEVVISGKSNVSDASARFSERKADNIINVVSAKTIELSPDLTVANVIQRVSGVTLERNNSGDGQYALLRGMDKRFN
ncbi:MAG: TonB-dependent receptor, partial [Mariniphaga sp.]|nr:TonB-dependent receptor [Mariniphaga sp.]